MKNKTNKPLSTLVIKKNPSYWEMRVSLDPIDIKMIVLLTNSETFKIYGIEKFLEKTYLNQS